MKESTNPRYFGNGTPPPVGRDNIQLIEIVELPDVRWNEGCVIKYVYRHRHKGGLSDLDKAQWYLNRIREQYLLEHSEDNTGEHDDGNQTRTDS
jgi:hypothetical protein